MNLGIRTVAAGRPADPVLANWQEQVRSAVAQGTALVIEGGRSKSFYGRPSAGETLATAAYQGIIDYEPTELVIAARCGTPLAEIDAALAERGQLLAFEPPRFGGSPTLGGVVAAGLSGPRRMAVGAVRDFVLGARLLDGKGELLNFGGQVMKNVAGYDVSRLLAGSLGCLGVLVEVSLKVLPRPLEEATLHFDLSEAEAFDRFEGWAGQSLPISASAWFEGALRLRLSGAGPAVAAARRTLGGEVLEEGEALAFWTGLRDQTAAFFALGSAALIRLALPAGTPVIPLPGPPLIEWGGAQRWCRTEPSRLAELRALAVARGGHATLFRAPSGRDAGAVFTPLSAPLLRIHRALKQRFDPAGVFNRGRMYAEL
ncbi:MAG: glycolate oxidase subunit GlcE [Candidatus Competibacteraceae bacterium]|nr:glycolate oxidase subunit GlcE [Candidatus Competibacteraceae bacterium]MBK7983978.1 glycolate oxidase subunit GlcE [Candidatus Competibacteraceae bacterium]MBK8897480.1 glycolate oxidase subunit GlcE [Candidatus Competibacteraceae bacterium]MBK8963632.1 glycolate oxidase subunit GlcE [Candidatus Competibacteraceae bacterium]MBK9950523.1 glycolate oxidase subunit GlcE [Candidatus Competibacteraceae bacterium]